MCKGVKMCFINFKFFKIYKIYFKKLYIYNIFKNPSKYLDLTLILDKSRKLIFCNIA